MDPKFRSSFIPKKPLPVKGSNSSVRKRRSSFNLFTFISSLVFIVAIGLSGVAFVYERVMQNTINQKGLELQQIVEEFDVEQIDQFKTLAEKIELADDLLNDHHALTEFFDVLNRRTLHNVRYTGLGFDQRNSGSDASLELQLSGVAADYNALAVQSDIFKNEPTIADFSFTSIELEDTEINGVRQVTDRVAFEIELVLNEAELIYQPEQ